LSPLGLCGLLLAAGQWRRLALLYFSFIVLVFAAVLFYISGRYRLAILPVLFPFAGHGAVCLVSSISARAAPRVRLKRLGTRILPAIGIFAAVNGYDPSDNLSTWHSDIIFGQHITRLCYASLDKGDLPLTRRYAQKLLWVRHAAAQSRGHFILQKLEHGKGNDYEALTHEGMVSKYMEELENLPKDSKGRDLFPPSY